MANQVPASPGMQPWIRSVENRIAAQSRNIYKLNDSVGAASRTPAFVSTITVLDSPAGATPGWVTMPGAPDLMANVSAGTGQLKITVTAYLQCHWTSSVAAAAGIAMRFNLAENNQLGIGVIPGSFRGDGIAQSFNFAPGDVAYGEVCLSYSTVLAVGKQQYTVRSEYLYNHLTDGITVRWAQRSLIAEPI